MGNDQSKKGKGNHSRAPATPTATPTPSSQPATTTTPSTASKKNTDPTKYFPSLPPFSSSSQIVEGDDGAKHSLGTLIIVGRNRTGRKRVVKDLPWTKIGDSNPPPFPPKSSLMDRDLRRRHPFVTRTHFQVDKKENKHIVAWCYQFENERGLQRYTFPNKAVYILTFRLVGSIYSSDIPNWLEEIRGNPQSRNCPIILVATNLESYESQRQYTMSQVNSNTYVPTAQERLLNIVEFVKRKWSGLNIIGDGTEPLVPLILEAMETMWTPGIPPLYFNLLHQTPPYNPDVPLLTRADIHQSLSTAKLIGPEFPLQSALNFIVQAGLLTCLKKTPAIAPPTGFSIEGFKNLSTNPMDPFELLPIEIIAFILHFVDIDTLGQAEIVSKKWQSVTTSDLIWEPIVDNLNVRPEKTDEKSEEKEPKKKSKKQEYKEWIQGALFINMNVLDRWDTVTPPQSGYHWNINHPHELPLLDAILYTWMHQRTNQRSTYGMGYRPFIPPRDNREYRTEKNKDLNCKCAYCASGDAWRNLLIDWLVEGSLWVKFPDDTYTWPEISKFNFMAKQHEFTHDDFDVWTLPWGGVHRIAVEFIRRKDLAKSWRVYEYPSNGITLVWQEGVEKIPDQDPKKKEIEKIDLVQGSEKQVFGPLKTKVLYYKFWIYSSSLCPEARKDVDIMRDVMREWLEREGILIHYIE